MPGEGPTRGFFDLWSRSYDNPLLQAATYRPVQNVVVEAVRRQRPRRVLDVGCGTGLLSARLAGELGVPVTGCDYSRGMLAKAAAHSWQPGWVQADAMALPVAGGAFDCLVSTESFHWYPDQPRALREFARALAPGGRAYVALVNPPSNLVTRVAARWTRLAGQPLRWPTTAEMRAMAATAGFRVVAQQRVLRIPVTVLFPSVVNIFERMPTP